MGGIIAPMFGYGGAASMTVMLLGSATMTASINVIIANQKAKDNSSVESGKHVETQQSYDR